jgi:hypothetical protein
VGGIKKLSEVVSVKVRVPAVGGRPDNLEDTTSHSKLAASQGAAEASLSVSVGLNVFNRLLNEAVALGGESQAHHSMLALLGKTTEGPENVAQFAAVELDITQPQVVG